MYALSAIFARMGFPGGPLIAGLIVGIAHGLLSKTALVAPRPVLLGSQAVIGVGAGTLVQRAALQDVAAHWLPVVFFTFATLALSVALGLVLARLTTLDSATASFGMIAGGASGMVAISHELGADARLVATMQYLRVIIVFGTIPVVAGLLYGASSDDAPHSPASSGLFVGGLSVAAVATVGSLLARLTRLPTGSLLGPMLLAATLSLAAAPHHLTVPPLVQALALAALGLSVGFQFSGKTLRNTGRILPAVLTAIVTMIAACALVGAMLAPLAHVSQLAGYLATSPGGLPVVLGTTVTTDAEGTFVLSLQVLRVCLMLLIAPLLARLLIQGGDRTSRRSSPG